MAESLIPASYFLSENCRITAVFSKTLATFANNVFQITRDYDRNIPYNHTKTKPCL